MRVRSVWGYPPRWRIDSVKPVVSVTPLTKIDFYEASISLEIYFIKIDSSREGRGSLKSHDKNRQLKTD